MADPLLDVLPAARRDPEDQPVDGAAREALKPQASFDQGVSAIRRLTSLTREVLHCQGVAVLTYGQQGDPVLHCEPPLIGDLARVLVANVDALTPDGTVLALDRTNICFLDGEPVRRAELRLLRNSTGSMAGVLVLLTTGGDVHFRRGGPLLEQIAKVFEDHFNLLQIGVRDYLTGLYNRRFFDEMANREWRRARRDLLPITVLMADVDYFKSYNDSAGHPAGDRVLRSIAACMSGTFRRAADVLARYGGEEFAAILPQTDLEGGRRAGERLCAAVQALRIPHPGRGGDMSISIGVATASTELAAGTGLSQLIRAADEALYRAKHAGRARVEVAEG